MLLNLVILQIIAHFLADFIFQPQKWSDKKEEKALTWYHFYHISVVGILSYLLSFDIGFWKAAILITVIHFLMDIFKSSLSLQNRTKNLFFFDQLIHLISIIAIVYAYSLFYQIDFIFDMKLNTILIASGFILCAKPSNVIIKNLLIVFHIDTPKENNGNEADTSLPNAGALIGIAERFLALSLIIMGQFEAVGLIIAAKSILRFSGTQKSEYVLIGTLLSFGIAVFCGILISLLN